MKKNLKPNHILSIKITIKCKHKYRFVFRIPNIPQTQNNIREGLPPAVIFGICVANIAGSILCNPFYASTFC